jgi:hypothetical protein
MKKISIAIFLVVILMFAAVPAWALLYLGSTNSLPNSNPDTEERWLEGVLGLTYNSPTVNYITKYDFPGSSHYQSLNQFDPECSWAYVVIKNGKDWNAYQSEGEPYLTVDPFGKEDISHVTFFGNSTPVPEPGTMLLLGLGLLGLGITTRRKS